MLKIKVTWTLIYKIVSNSYSTPYRCWGHWVKCQGHKENKLNTSLLNNKKSLCSALVACPSLDRKVLCSIPVTATGEVNLRCKNL